MSQPFAWGGQSNGVSASASFLPKKSQGWSPSEWTGWISLQSKGLSRVFSNTTVQKHQSTHIDLKIPYSSRLLLVAALLPISPVHVREKLLQSCLTLCDTLVCSPPGFSVLKILQARILEWVAMPSSGRSSQPREQTHVSCLSALAGGFFTTSATWESLLVSSTLCLNTSRSSHSYLSFRSDLKCHFPRETGNSLGLCTSA